MNSAWVRAYASAHSGIATHQQTGPRPGGFSIPEWALERHTCLFGATGGGKSRLALHLVSEHIRQGGSVVILDPKSQTIAQLLDRCRIAGMRPAQIVVLDPADPDVGTPGWNPLITGLPPAQAAADLVSILKQSSDSWGPRLSDILTNALVLLGALKLSLYEVPRLLTRADYRSALLRLPLPSASKASNRGGAVGLHTSSGAAVREARDFFAHEFSAWPRSDQAGAIAPVLTRVRSLLGSDFLQPLLCARRNTLDLASLWQRPGAVLVHLDRTALGDEGARLLGGLIAHQLYRTALRSPGPIPVLLALDELGAQERFIGSALIDIVTVGRSQNLRLLAATQHLAGLSTELREALLANAGVQASFQTGYEDARLLGSSFAVGAEETLSHVTATVAARNRITGLAEHTTWRHLIRDGSGHILRLSKSAWQELRRYEAVAPPGKAAALLRVQSLAAASGTPRLYVHAADTERPVALSRYVRGLPEEDYWFDGPAPLELIVSFPRPKFTSIKRDSAGDLAARWTRSIHQLPTQHAAVRVRGSEPEIIRILDVETSDGAESDPTWTSAARAAGAQSFDEIEGVATWRTEQVERIAAGRELDSNERFITDIVPGAAKAGPAVEALSEIRPTPQNSTATPFTMLSSDNDGLGITGTPDHRMEPDALGFQKASGLPEGANIREEVNEDGSIA